VLELLLGLVGGLVGKKNPGRMEKGESRWILGRPWGGVGSPTDVGRNVYHESDGKHQKLDTKRKRRAETQ